MPIGLQKQTKLP